MLLPTGVKAERGDPLWAQASKASSLTGPASERGTEMANRSWARIATSLTAGMALLAIGACGGSDAGSRDPLVVSGTVLADGGASQWTVCLDLNADRRCDEDEPSTTSDLTGRYALSVPASAQTQGAALLAERGTGAERAWLAAPAGTPTISVLSTLIALHAGVPIGADSPVAARPVRELFAFPADSDPLDAVSWPDDDRLNSSLATMFEAWSKVISTQPEAAGSSDGSSRSAGTALLNATQRYLDPQTRRLLPGVGARTLAWEATQALNPHACSVLPPRTLHVSTNDAAPIETKTDYVKGRLRIEGSGEDAELPLKIRGRGNSTWQMPKKPYRLKLDTASPLFGMAADRNWVLLANYADKTMLRNALAFCLGEVLGMDFTPASRFVELHLNGDYQGLYQLTEQVKVASHRVDIGTAIGAEVATEGEMGADPGGFLVEIDARMDEDFVFEASLTRLPFAVKSDTDAEGATRIQAVIDRFEQSLYAAEFDDPERGYNGQLDVMAMVDFFLVNELLRNNDFFFSSTYVHRKDRGPLVFGPLWDFDIAAGNVDYNGNEEPEGWWARERGYMPRLFEDASFDRLVRVRWQFLRSRMPEVLAFIGQAASTLDEAQARNFALWDILSQKVWPNPVVTGSYAGEIAYLLGWLERRSAWLDAQFAIRDEH